MTDASPEARRIAAPHAGRIRVPPFKPFHRDRVHQRRAPTPGRGTRSQRVSDDRKSSKTAYKLIGQRKRAKGIEPSTCSLEGCRSTAELRPQREAENIADHVTQRCLDGRSREESGFAKTRYPAAPVPTTVAQGCAVGRPGRRIPHRCSRIFAESRDTYLLS